MTNYKFDEERLLKELQEYIDSTYKEHYSRSGEGIQVTEFIMSNLSSPDFLRGNVLKYAARYGHKDGYNRKDLWKAIHYLLLMLCFHDRRYANKDEIKDIFHDFVKEQNNKEPKTNIHKKMQSGGEGTFSPAYFGNTVSVSDVQTTNVYVKLEGGKIGQEQNGVVVEVGYGDLDELGRLKPGTFSYKPRGGRSFGF